ncbi:hypothetical protein [Pectobacterium brasiliense]
MSLIIGVVLFFVLMWWLYKKDIVDNDELAVIVVFAGFALAGYLGTSQY